MSRSVGSILLLLLGAVQGLALCPCRAEHLVSPVASHEEAGGDTEGRANRGAHCNSRAPYSPRFCDSHLQTKQSNGEAGVAMAAVAEFDVVQWAEPHIPRTACPASDPPPGAAGLLSRSTPLLI
jgi:hypothetical protein